MPHPADQLNKLTLQDYAVRAFGQAEGGMFAGVGSRHARADAETRRRMKALGLLPSESFSRARLVRVAPGKVFVRWCKARDAQRSFAAAAGGAWWSSDNVADGIIRLTEQRLGPQGDSGQVAREVSAVHHGWSDLQGAVVVRTTSPINVLVGFGRPVVSQAPGSSVPVVLGDGRDLQFMLLTSWDNRFVGGSFLEELFRGSSTTLLGWWRQHSPVRQRRAERG